jgi:hypothetical protein
VSSFEKIAAASPVNRDGPHAWIQWKGTGVCADIYCSCGRHGHIDEDFTYSIRCPCGRLWGMDPNVTLVPLDEADVVGECEPKMVEDDEGFEDDEDNNATAAGEG